MSQFTVIKKAFGQGASGPSTTRMAVQRRSYPFLSPSAGSRMQVFTLKKRNVDRTPYLTFTALDPDSSVKLTYMAEDAEAPLSTSQTLSGVSFEISENGSDWTPYGFQQTSMNAGDTLKIRATNKNYKLAASDTYGLRFIMTGRIAASGSIMSLLYSNVVSSFQSTNTRAFAYLFKDCSALVAAPELPAETVYDNVYRGMFINCVNLSSGPVLRVNGSKYAPNAFAHMFENCRSLTSVEGDISISSDQTSYMFNEMFKNCVSLVSPPDISVLYVHQYMFQNMFEYCSSLTSTIDMTVHDIINSSNSFAGMYCGCISLKTNRLRFDIISAGYNSFRGMFRDCWNLTSAPDFGEISVYDDTAFLSAFSNCERLSSTPSLTAACVSKDAFKYMFKGCKRIQTCQNISLPAMDLSSGCYYGMFEQCNALTDTPQLPATTLATDCYRAMFAECYALKDAPYLPATTMATTSYRYMFNNCKSLSSISVELTSWNPSGATNAWTTGVQKTGVFTCPASLAQTRGANNIPTGWTINTH